jgi:hypothetical protein
MARGSPVPTPDSEADGAPTFECAPKGRNCDRWGRLFPGPIEEGGGLSQVVTKNPSHSIWKDSMKKSLVVLCAMLSVLGMVGIAGATIAINYDMLPDNTLANAQYSHWGVVSNDEYAENAPYGSPYPLDSGGAWLAGEYGGDYTNIVSQPISGFFVDPLNPSLLATTDHTWPHIAYPDNGTTLEVYDLNNNLLASVQENSCGIARFVFFGDFSPEDVVGIDDFTFEEITTPNLNYPFPLFPVPEPETPFPPPPAEGPEPSTFPLLGSGLRDWVDWRRGSIGNSPHRAGEGGQYGAHHPGASRLWPRGAVLSRESSVPFKCPRRGTCDQSCARHPSLVSHLSHGPLPLVLQTTLPH